MNTPIASCMRNQVNKQASQFFLAFNGGRYCHHLYKETLFVSSGVCCCKKGC